MGNLAPFVLQGHVDFAWEVSRSLAACQGALLLVDASQGVQAQSISVFHIAKERGLKIIPVLTKVRSRLTTEYDANRLRRLTCPHHSRNEWPLNSSQLLALTRVKFSIYPRKLVKE